MKLKNSSKVKNVNKIEPIRIILFEDSDDALKRFEKTMELTKYVIKRFVTPRINEKRKKEIQNFKPQLILLDLALLGNSKEESYMLLQKIYELKMFENVPIIIISKFINESSTGLREKERCLNIPGVVAAYGKIPDYPSAEELLKYIRN